MSWVGTRTIICICFEWYPVLLHSTRPLVGSNLSLNGSQCYMYIALLPLSLLVLVFPNKNLNTTGHVLWLFGRVYDIIIHIIDSNGHLGSSVLIVNFDELGCGLTVLHELHSMYLFYEIKYLAFESSSGCLEDHLS